jgi:hypothetical protein
LGGAAPYRHEIVAMLVPVTCGTRLVREIGMCSV